MLAQGVKRSRDEDPAPPEAPRPRKRPGGTARIAAADLKAIEQRKQQRAAEASAGPARGVEEVVRQHYNAVPERGRDWRKTDSRIKGLRSFNNWIKSTVIHKFSPGEPGTMLRVLDIGCGKGGDLQKWQKAPQPVELYVGVDPAEISIEQARDRYRQMRSRGGRGGRGGWRGGGRGGYNDQAQRLFDAEFIASDAFAFSLGDLQIIREVGFGPGSRWGPAGGFDCVSMMFCMHYAFENEAKAKGMLANVAGSLKKGGRFFGVIPNSDVLRDGITEWHKQKDSLNNSTVLHNGSTQDDSTKDRSAEDHHAKDLPTKDDSKKDISTKHDFTKTNSPTNDSIKDDSIKDSSIADGSTKDNSVKNESTKPNSSHATDPKEKQPPAIADPSLPPSTAEWGNSIYRVRFPGETPKDGIFRPQYGWKYSYFMEEAVEEVPEYVVPWEAFRAIAEDYNLELQYRKPFAEVWQEEKNNPVFGPLSEQMGVRGRDAGPLLITGEEMEAASFYHAFCFYKI